MKGEKGAFAAETMVQVMWEELRLERLACGSGNVVWRRPAHPKSEWAVPWASQAATTDVGRAMKGKTTFGAFLQLCAPYNVLAKQKKKLFPAYYWLDFMRTQESYYSNIG